MIIERMDLVKQLNKKLAKVKGVTVLNARVAEGSGVVVRYQQPDRRVTQIAAEGDVETALAQVLDLLRALDARA